MLAQRIGSSTVPRSYGYVPVESSIRRALLQSSFDSVTAAALSRAATTYLGFCPLLDIIASLPICVLPRHAGVSLGVLNRPSTSAMRLASLFHPAAEPRTSFSFRGLSTSRSFSLSSNEICTHAVELPHAHLQAGCHARGPRLRCFAPREAACHSVR